MVTASQSSSMQESQKGSLTCLAKAPTLNGSPRTDYPSLSNSSRALGGIYINDCILSEVSLLPLLSRMLASIMSCSGISP